MKQKIAYFGRSLEMIDYLLESDFFEIQIVLSDIDGEIKEKCKKRNIPFYKVKNNEDVSKALQDKEINNIIIFLCGIIIKDILLRKYNFYNFHPGDLRNNRGATPIIWSILRGDSCTQMTLYKVGKGIDLGKIIAKEKVYIQKDEGSLDLYKKLIETIPRLLIQFHLFLSQKIESLECVKEGEYLPKVQKKDYVIDLEKDSFEIMKRKILSQQMYDGAIVLEGDKEIRVRDIEMKCEHDKVIFQFATKELK